MSDLKGLKLSGMKKTSWYTPKGKQMGLITFGKKKDVIIPLDDYEWENVLNIDIKKQDVDAGDLRVWLKNDYQKNNRILQYNKLSKYLYMDSNKAHWLDYSLVDSFHKSLNQEQVTVRGKILYTKKNAGFFLLLLGNWYFLPKGESLTFYRPGIWQSNYGAVVSKVGLYTEGITNFVFSNFLKKLDFKTSVDKIKILHNILEQLIAHELSYVFYKGSRRNKRAKKVRNRALMCYGYFLYILSPVIKDMDRLQRIAEQENIDIEKVLQKGVELREQRINQHEELLVETKKRLAEATTTDELYFYWVYSSLLELVCNSSKNSNVKMFKLSRLGGVEVAFSKADKRRLTSVSRRNII